MLVFRKIIQQNAQQRYSKHIQDMNNQTAYKDIQNRGFHFSRKGNHERNKQNNHAQPIATFDNSSHVLMIVEQIYGGFLCIWRNVGLKIKEKHHLFCLL